MPYSVTSAEIKAFNADGAVLLKGVIGPDWLDRVAAAIERDIEKPGPFFHGYDTEGKGRFHGNLRVWETDPDLRAYCFESGLAEVAAQFFGASRVNLLYDQLFVKEPGTAQPTRWHNDQPYWPVRGWQVMSFWLALDPTTAENGRLEFVRGSHRWDRWFQPEAFGKTTVNTYDDNPDYEKMPDIDAARGDYDIVAWDMEPGDASRVPRAGGARRRRQSARRRAAARLHGALYRRRRALRPSPGHREGALDRGSEGRRSDGLRPLSGRVAARGGERRLNEGVAFEIRAGGRRVPAFRPRP